MYSTHNFVLNISKTGKVIKMPQNKLSADLQNTSDYKLENAKTDAAISEAYTEYAMNGELHNARSAFAFLKRKYFSHTYNI